jgi:hypothetical protein
MVKQVKRLKISKSKNSQREKFLEVFSKFYEQFFSGLATSIETLAELQKTFPDAYDGIRSFSSDPSAIDKVLDKLDYNQRGILLNVLLKAGDFSRRTSMLFDSTESEKRKLAKDLKDFVEILNDMLKQKK